MAIVALSSCRKLFLCLLLTGCETITESSEDVRCSFQEPVVVEYIDAVYYSGSTEFIFRDDAGFEFSIRQSNDPGAMIILNSEILVDEFVEDSLPEPEKRLLGRNVRLHYNLHCQVVKFELTLSK